MLLSINPVLTLYYEKIKKTLSVYILYGTRK